MTNQTENYLLLKPISERINRICAEMSDSELKSLIREALKEQITDAMRDTYYSIQSIAEDAIDRNEEAICAAVKESLMGSLHLDRGFDIGWR